MSRVLCPVAVALAAVSTPTLKFLQTAKNPRGNMAGSPMPAYMLKAEDADTFVAYLKSLP